MIKRMSGHHHFEITPSTFITKKLKDMWHLIGVCSIAFYGSIILYSNIFIGPAQLAEIPEGYNPKHWEYYRVCYSIENTVFFLIFSAFNFFQREYYV